MCLFPKEGREGWLVFAFVGCRRCRWVPAKVDVRVRIRARVGGAVERDNKDEPGNKKEVICHYERGMTFGSSTLSREGWPVFALVGCF